VERELGREAKDATMTVGERLIQQGVQQGIQQGVQQGIQQGVQQGKCEALLGVLRQRFGAEVTTDTEQRLASASLAQIELWLGRVLTATTLNEVLAG